MKLIKKIISFYKDLLAPRSKDKDVARREYILNILLINALVLSFVFTLSSWITLTISQVFNIGTSGLPPTAVFLVFLIFLLCYVISRKGKIKIAAYLLVSIYFFGATYTIYRWGINVPQALLTYALIIVTSAMVISSRAAFIITLVISGCISLIVQLQYYGNIPVSSAWREVPPHIGDAFSYSITLLVIAIVAWLSNREVERALRRAQLSESELRYERDNLEQILAERTRALQQSQLERIAQLEKFAEVGKISSGLIHDLTVPLNLVSLNLQRLNKEEQKKKAEQIVKNDIKLERAMKGITRLESFVESARKRLRNQEIKEKYSLSDGIEQVLQALSFYANEKKVQLRFSYEKDIKTYGYPVKFQQVITNIVGNAIDAYDQTSVKAKKKEVFIEMSKNKNIVQIEIYDKGIGIKKEDLRHIFEPFFSTKNGGGGLGIGLSLCKSMIEKDFHGTITVDSTEATGTVFYVKFPIEREKKTVTNAKQ